MSHSIRKALLTALIVLTAGCAYRLGYTERSLPEGYDRVGIPVFSNKTQEVGVEPYFTNAIIQEFERSDVARVVDRQEAGATLEGVVESITFKDNAQAKAGKSSELENLPDSTVLTTEYRVLVVVRIRLRRNSDKQVIWSGKFKDERVYSAPQIALPLINSANALYNHNARHQNVRKLALDMMAEAHDRMTENF